MKPFFLILAAFLLLACGITSPYVPAEVLAGIQMTQTAAAHTPTPVPVIATAIPAATSLPPSATPAPLDLGANKRILLQTGRCSPAGSPDCQWEAAAVYSSNPHGGDLEQVFETGEVLGVSSDGRQALVAIPNPDQPTFTLNLVDLASISQVKLAENFHHTFGCDGNHCEAIELSDGMIAFLGEGAVQNGQPQINIYLVNPDGSGATPLLAQAPAQPPLYLYRSSDAERIYWEAGNGAVPAGLNVIRTDGSELRQESGVIDPAFSPDGSQVAYLKLANDLGYQTALFVASSGWEDPSQIYTPQTGEYAGRYRWSPDGQRLVLQAAVCGASCTAKHYLWKTGAAALVELPAALGFIQASPYWTNDGRYVLYIHRDQTSGKQAYLALNPETFDVQPFLEKLSLPDEGLEVEYFYTIP